MNTASAIFVSLTLLCSAVVAIPFYDPYDYCSELRHNTTLKNFDFTRYLGKWYEIYRTPDFYFEHGCECTTANYKTDSREGLRSVGVGGTLRIENSCVRSSILHGSRRDTSIGKATIVGTASLDVSFGLPFTASYDIIYIDKKYQYAVVTSCNDLVFFNKLYIWVLSRTKDGALDVDAMNDISKRFVEVGLKNEWAELSQTNQTDCYYGHAETYDTRVCDNRSDAKVSPTPCYEGYHVVHNKFVESYDVDDIVAPYVPYLDLSDPKYKKQRGNK